jgi:hypothetical protein
MKLVRPTTVFSQFTRSPSNPNVTFATASTIVRSMFKGDGSEAERLFEGRLPPVLLLDRQGPRSGILTDLVARHFEEMDGDHCFR